MGTQPVGIRDVVHGRGSSRLRLLAPLRYLWIQHPEKHLYDVKLPVCVAAISWLTYLVLDPKPRLFGADGLLAIVRDVLMMAVPFMIGALATVAMASGPNFDHRARGANLLLEGKVLTLRQFVCYLLGYMSFLGLVTLGGVIAAQLLHAPVSVWLHGAPLMFVGVHAAGALVLSLLCSALVVTVFWALYFLTAIVTDTD
jgi:hypothetical protein